MVALSFIMSTARDDFPILADPNLHLFEPTARSLLAQTCQDFELIVVDALRAERADWWPLRLLNYPVQHISPKPGSWVERGYWGVCAGFNTGIAHARGRFICVIGDCSEFKADAVEVALWHLERGRRPAFGFQKMQGDVPRQKDIRLDRVQRHDGQWLTHQWGDQFYGYSCCTLEDCLKVNGYDERFDGSKSLEDCDFGLRVQRAIGRPDWALDKRLTVVEHEHAPIPERVITNKPPFKTNYPLFLMNKVLKRIEANRRPFSEQELAFLKSPPSEGAEKKFAHYWDEFRWDSPDFKRWLHEPAIFDLTEQRLRIVRGQKPW